MSKGGCQELGEQVKEEEIAWQRRVSGSGLVETMVKVGLTAKRENHAVESPQKAKVSDHILHVDPLKHNVPQLRKRKLDRLEFRGKRKHLKRKRNEIRKKI